jgi:thymidylate kinase
MVSIKKYLAEDKLIICDRYWYSGVAYSYGRGLNFEWCLNADKGII